MRISAEEFYNDKDLITQIERLKDKIAGCTIKEIISLQEPDSGEVTLVFKFEDDTEQRVTFKVKELVNVEGEQVDDVVSLKFEFSDGDVKTVAFRTSEPSDMFFQDIKGNPYDNSALKEALDAKLDEADIEQIRTELNEHDTKLNEIHEEQQLQNLHIDEINAKINDEIQREIISVKNSITDIEKEQEEQDAHIVEINNKINEEIQREIVALKNSKADYSETTAENDIDVSVVGKTVFVVFDRYIQGSRQGFHVLTNNIPAPLKTPSPVAVLTSFNGKTYTVGIDNGQLIATLVNEGSFETDRVSGVYSYIKGDQA